MVGSVADGKVYAYSEAGMKKWLRRIRGALGMGLTWALVWAPVAVLLGILVDPDGSMDEMWVAVGAYPGFLGGVVFSIVLAIAARRRGLAELSIARAALWGGFAGLLVGTLPFTLGTPTSEVPLWLLAGVVIGSITLLSAVSAAGSLALAKRAERRALGIAPRRALIDRQGQDVGGMAPGATAAPAVRPTSSR
jgi:hypothetical protein